MKYKLFKSPMSEGLCCIRHGLRSTSLPDSKILEEWSKILPYSSLCETLALLSSWIGHFTYKSSPKCDKITYVPISGFFPVTKKWNRVLVLLETFRSNFEFFLTSPTARLKKIQNWISKSLVKLKSLVSFFYPRKILILVHK